MAESIIYECSACGIHSKERLPTKAFQDITGVPYVVFVCADCVESLDEIEKESTGRFISMLQEMANTARRRHVR